jgi:NitT/TauT family transport system substrate-binding protein
MKFRSLACVTGAVAIALLVNAPSGFPTVQAQEKPQTTLRYASWGPKLVDQADFFVAEEMGYFKDEGLKIEWIAAQGGGDALRHVIAGNADFAATDPVLILFSLDRGVKVKAFYAVTPRNQFTIIARKSKGIRTIADLRDKRIAITSMASGSRYNVMTILNSNQLKESDVTLIATGLNFAGPIEQSQVDAAGTWEIMNWDLMNRVLPKSVVEDLLVFKASDYLNVPTNVYATTEELLTSKRDLLLRFIRAHRRATEYMHAHPHEAAAMAAKHAVAAKDDAERNLEVVKLRIGMQLDEGAKLHGFGWLTDKVLDDFALKYQQWGLVKNTYTFDAFATNELVQQLGK